MGKSGRRKLNIFAAALSALLLCACGKSGEESVEKTVVITKDSSDRYEQTDITGDWYGWWKVENTVGGWDGSDTNWWDCCACIGGKDGEYGLCLWDENFSRERSIADFALLGSPDGIAFTDGKLLGIRLVEEECQITLTEDENGKLLTVSGHYFDAETKDSFDFCVYLRPWGDKWSEDAPYHYETWYLPLTEAGCPMPDKIDTDKAA